MKKGSPRQSSVRARNTRVRSARTRAPMFGTGPLALGGLGVMTVRRILSGLLLLAGVVASVIVARSEVTSEQSAFGTSFRPGTPALVAGEDAITSTWFCGGTSALGSSPEGEYGGEIVITNTQDSDATALVTVLTADQPPATQVVIVKGRSRESVDIDQMVKAPYASAYVEVDKANASVEQRAIHPAGVAVSPCANQTSAEWYFPDGFTASSSDLRILVSNPYLTPSIVDIAISTSEGPRSPSNLQGYVIPARSLRVLNIAQVGFRDEKVVAISVKANSGRVVAAKYQHYLGTGRLGHVMSLGASSLSDQWLFADGEKGAGITENYMILNPTSEPVVADLVILGVDPTLATIPPTAVTVPPGEVVVFDVSTIPGLPDGDHGAVITSRTGENLAVERILTRPVEGTFSTSAVIGVQRGFLSNRWRASVGVTLPIDRALMVLNTSGSTAKVSVLVLGPAGEVPIEGFIDMELAANDILPIDLTDPDLVGLALEIVSDQPILVERRLERNSTLRGRSGSLALPE